ncbi:MAG TPA: fumarylacetoacetate hydrolase family protein [Candidatus Limnocylindrales bacterium]|nr:fumarylacetoacetate hydrolase family protein [Candidatus Limnocylindrales bacterium]
MRLGTIYVDGRPRVAAARMGRVVPLPPGDPAWTSMRALAGAGPGALERIRAWLEDQPIDGGRATGETEDGEVRFGPAVPDPGAIYTVGLNYRSPGGPPDAGPDRPLIYGKAAGSVAGHGATLSWDRSVTDDVDAEVELGVVIGAPAFRVEPGDAMGHVFGYTCINDISARDERLDGDQWLLGKSMPGFCPVGPWIVTADELDPSDLSLGCAIDGAAIQDDRTSNMRFAIPEIVAYLSRHLELRPGDLIATGTPVRLETPPGPGRRLRPGDTVTAWIERIGTLTTTIA